MKRFERSAGLEHEVAWHRGRHGAAPKGEKLKWLAEFLATGRPSPATLVLMGLADDVDHVTTRPWVARLLLLFIIGMTPDDLGAPRRSCRLTVVASLAAIALIMVDVI